jgi:hypothetical protein
MYHGEFERPGKTPRFGEWPQPIQLTKNLAVLGEILAPSTALIVSERVRSLLEATQCLVEFHRIEFAKTFYYPFAPGTTDVEAANDPVFVDALERMHSDESSCERPAASYYEVLMNVSGGDWHGAQDADCLEFYEVESSSAPCGEKAVSLSVVERMGMLYAHDGYVVRHDVFEAIRPNLDPTYFISMRGQ